MTVDSVEEARKALPLLDEAGRALLFTSARTANSFAPTAVTDAELDSVWELAKWPPTAANTQPLRVLYVRTPQGRERLVRHMNDGNKAKTATAPAVAVLAMDTQFHEHIPQLVPFRPELKDAFAANDTMRTETMQFSGALQTRVLPARGARARPGRGPDGRLRRGRPGRRILPRRPLEVRPGGQHRPSRPGSMVRPAAAPGSRRRHQVGLTA